MGMVGERANLMARESENDATRGLISNYTALNTNTPIRTPRAPAQEDHIANEIRNIRALTNTQSSLLGGENTPLHEGAGSTGFESVAPRKNVVATPNPLATPLRSAANGGATPLRPGQTPMRTPRDSFALNSGDDDMSMVGSTPADVKMRDVALKHQLKLGLASLPRPKESEWDLELPDEQQETRTAEQMEEDAADRDRREREIREAREELERKRRTQVMQRKLPRPVSVDLEALVQASLQLEDPAERMVGQEAALLMASDSVKYPLPGSKSTKKSVPVRDIDDAALAEARLMILMEAKNPGAEEVQAAWEGQGNNSLLLGLGCYDDDDEDQVLTMRAAFEVRMTIPSLHFATLAWCSGR